jgi:hypothetical protein
VPSPDLEETQIVPLELDQPKLLLGEGKDEVNIFRAFLNHLGIENVRVEDYGGKNKLPDYLDALKLRPGFSSLNSLGITRDADEDAAAAFVSTHNYLSSRGFSASNASGLIQPGTPNVGIMIFPDGANRGMLEDVCLQALKGDAVMPCINNYFDCIREIGSAPRQISKARVHAWLAAQTPPDMRLGFAAQRGLLDWINPAFDRLRAFITSL